MLLTKYLSLSLVVLLLGCAAPEPIPVTASAAPTPAPMPAPVMVSAPVAVPVAVPVPVDVIPFRQFLYSKDKVLQEPYSVVIFTHRPESAADKKTYVEACKKWLGDYETLDVVKSYSPVNAKLLPFYYPTTMSSSKGHSCDADLYAYDYGRATVLLAGLRYGATAGPLLALRQHNSWFVLDISKFQPVDVERAFTIWKSKIAIENPTKVSFKYTTFKEYFRTLVQSYGTDIIKYIPKLG